MRKDDAKETVGIIERLALDDYRVTIERGPLSDEWTACAYDMRGEHTDPNHRPWTTHVHVHQLADALPALETNVLARTDRKEA